MSTKAPETKGELSELLQDLFVQFQAGPGSGHVVVSLAISDVDAADGVTRDVEVLRPTACASCDGHGSAHAAEEAAPCRVCAGRGHHEQVQGLFTIATSCAKCRGLGRIVRDPCGACAGSGTSTKPTPGTVSVTVPAGATHGQTLTIAGAGATGRDGTVGDVMIYLLVGDRPDPRAAAFDEIVGDPALARASVHAPRVSLLAFAAIGAVVIVVLALLAR